MEELLRTSLIDKVFVLNNNGKERVPLTKRVVGEQNKECPLPSFVYMPIAHSALQVELNCYFVLFF